VSADEFGVQIRVSVSDTSIGIPEDKIGLIFEAFSQAEPSHTRQYGGAGLGLAITRRLVNRMGGALEVESAEGLGSTFRFVLPLEKTGAAASRISHRERGPTAKPYHVLLAEDNPVNQRLATRLLEKEGHTVTVVDTGVKVLERLTEGAFDAILMDVQMPEMDGLKATQAIREQEALSGKHIPIVALTAHATVDDRQRCLQAGVDAYFSKPILVEEFIGVLGQIGDKLGQK
jgi:CheY-like chemotaxis protein